MKSRNEAAQNYHSVSHNFKIAVVVLLFSFTAIRLVLVSYFPDADIIPDKALLIILLFVVSYLWIQETKDYYKLLMLNRDLQKTHEQLKQAEIDTIASLIKAEEEKDFYTRGHSERVTK